MGDLGAGITGFPGALDTNGTPETAANNTTYFPGEGAIAAAIAIETILGTNPQGSAATVKAFIQKEHDVNGRHTLYHSFSWFRDNVAANLTDSVLIVCGSATVSQIVVPAAGSIVGMSVYLNEARTADTLTLNVSKNGTKVTGPTLAINVTNATYIYVTYAIGTYTFVAGDRLGAMITTGATWTPVTADLVQVIFISYNL